MLTLAILSVSRLTGSIAADFMAVRQQGLYLRNYFSFLAYAEDEVGTRDVRADADGKIVFDNVRFAYPGSDTNALNGVSYTFQVGKKYGLVGANGSGKTTFIHLLMGLYHATEGQIRINGDAVETINREQYYALFAPVLQDFNTYAYSIRENVAFAERDGDEKITQLMDAMKLTKRLSQLPSGISTNLTTEYESEGTELSGGELQKIAIMRAFYKDTPILVLDEPTSALSPKSECELYQEINEMAAGKTVFFISHRMASCRMCDEILVFDGGSIVESGTHEALMQRDGLYRQMFSAQASLYAEETT